MSKGSRQNGSPYDRGSADRYYQRNYSPHWYPNGSYKGYRIGREDMSPEEIEEYDLGWEEEDDRKDWGYEDEEEDYNGYDD